MQKIKTGEYMVENGLPLNHDFHESLKNVQNKRTDAGTNGLPRLQRLWASILRTARRKIDFDKTEVSAALILGLAIGFAAGFIGMLMSLFVPIGG